MAGYRANWEDDPERRLIEDAIVVSCRSVDGNGKHQASSVATPECELNAGGTKTEHLARERLVR